MAVNGCQDSCNASETSIPRHRTSCLNELHIDGTQTTSDVRKRPRCVRFRSQSDVFLAPRFDGVSSSPRESSKVLSTTPDYTVLLKKCPEPSPQSILRSSNRSLPMPRMMPWTLLIAVVLALIHSFPLYAFAEPTGFGVRAGGLEEQDDGLARSYLDRRDASPTDVCTRWSQQTALINGTVYIYGGRATANSSQSSNEWNNNFFSLDVTNSWEITTPSLTSLAQPSGPPPVANGYLWHSYTSLFLFRGEYSDTPVTSPSSFALWEFEISSSTWKEHSSPRTLPGNYSDGGNQPVQPAAEGAGISIPALGKGWYFGGHQDAFTTAGWSIDAARVYLKSLIEYTFPGYPNSAIPALQDNQTAGIDGAWRNITQGGLQNTDGFTERADGVLVYIPGYGKQGIILGLAGGTNTTFTQMNIIDVYDVANSTWYKQATQGGPPQIRVNPCAVAASAADGSSTNVYLYGGQNLIPYGEQVQYGDMWILTVPSFTWIQVDDSDGAPPPRAGHTCEIWDGQIVVIGGYVGKNITCDPGFYIFDASSLKWQTSFNALKGSNDQSQQLSQEDNVAALSGSYGYEVPGLVQSVIGGNGAGGATVTSPAAGATGGPIATGVPIIYTLTASGATVTETAATESGGSSSGGVNVAAIVAGTLAGLLFCLACYLGFCAWLYRRQLQLYKAHVAAAQRAALAPPNEKTSFLSAQRSSEPPSSHGPQSMADSSINPSRAGGITPTSAPPIAARRDSDAGSGTDDIIEVQEPSFFGVLMRPRRSLRVVNRD